ncbi:XRE family transcriptional regulator [Leucobacter allii]|uniref:helix-turn-helix domain-containing protein n=1 Tax=Leucobacter allii TaxID=2932247 RepID=UPI001FD34272|nr:XRE family transcriptional regulator [Leucobacter allii]UOR01373.1 XRE family transcriptional regulator [Leucobacter allii]
MSLRALASAIGVSPSLLSQIETGKTKPSVSTLYSLVSQLNISTDALLGRDDHVPAPAAAPAGPPVFAPQPTTTFHHQSSAENPTLEMDNGVKWEKLSVLEGTDVEALRVTYQPGASSSIEGRLMRHFGIEHVYLISGELTLQLEFDRHVIRAGDSMVFDSQRPHLFVNEADEPALGVWYVTGRSGAASASGHGSEGVLSTAEHDEALNSAVDVLRTFRG